MERLNHYAVDYFNIEVYPSDYSLKYTTVYVPNTNNTPNNSINDDGLDQILEYFHSGHGSNILCVDLEMLQD